MKVFISIDDVMFKSAVGKVLRTLLGPDICQEVQSVLEADLIIVQDKRKLHEYYSTDKKFGIISEEKIESLPENVKWFKVTNLVSHLIFHISEINKELESESVKTVEIEAVETSEIYAPDAFYVESATRVLVVDDKQENLVLALKLLGEQNFVTLAACYEEARQLIMQNTYDVVLSDCQMPVVINNSALSVDAIRLGETVHNGLFLMFPATLRGARFAIVTDANHHRDWVSAIFDDLHGPQIINGQPVLFINYMGKKWDLALKKLKELQVV